MLLKNQACTTLF